MLFPLIALSLAFIVLAGPHDASHRRHHARAAFHRNHAAVRAGDVGFDNVKRDCEDGSWRCTGPELQHCNFDTWISISNCTGEDIVCSADERATGCIWSWSLDGWNGTPVTVSALPSSLIKARPSSSTSSIASTSSALSASSDNDDNNVIAFVTTTSSASIAPSTSSAAITSSAIASSASSIASLATAGDSVIGGNLYAGEQGWYDASTSSRRRKGKTSTQDWYGTPTTSTSSVLASSTSVSWDDGSYNPSTQDWYNAASSSQSVTSASTAQPTSSIVDWDVTTSSSKGRKSKTSSSAAPGPTDGGNGNTLSSYSAPHYVIYADRWLAQMPTADALSSYNRFILAFWMSGPGAVDNAQAWEQFDSSYRQQVLDEYHSAGIALMVSAFGSTDFPTSTGADPVDTAQRLASWVKKYGLDGVDVDYEDMDAMNTDKAEDWLITFQTELRRQLPAPYLISHAPVAPWFTSGKNYPSGAYVAVHKQTGAGINFYNIQFYNQGSVYEDCDSLIHDSGSSWPDTSAMQINSYAGVPLDKIVIGKPIDAGAASNGFIDGSLLATCVAEAQALGWNGGVMFWEWSPSIGNSLMATVRG